MGFFGWERKVFWTSILVRWGFPGGTMIKKLPANAGNVRDVGLICRSGRSPGGGQGNPLQYSYLENPLDRGRLQSMHLKTVGHDWSDLAHTVEAEARPHPLLLPILVQFSSVVQSCLTLCDPMDCNTPGFPVHRQHPELAQTHVHWVGDTIQPSHLPSSPSLPAFNLSQRQGLFSFYRGG